MIRFINCIKRRDNVSVEEFRRCWRDPVFPELQKELAKALGANRYHRALTLVVEANTLFQEERGLAEPGDGILEYWWVNARDLVNLIESPEGPAARHAMTEYQRHFVDFAATRAFFTEG